MRDTNRCLKFLGLLFLFCSFPLLSYAQSVTVKGVVNDAMGDPVIGASVVEIGTVNGVITDLDGNFILNVSARGKIKISFVGYKTVELDVAGKTAFNVVLKDDTELLNEVVVVGYGTMRKSDVTGSVSSVGAAEISKVVATSLDQALQGRAAGLQMTQNSGLPGGGTSIRIRGVSSINSSNEPIVVIDGVIIDSNTGTNTDNAFQSINPSDIESVEILKDASATAIYGAQGANGVILVTTKKGVAGATRINFDAYWGLQQIPKYIDMMDLRQYAEHNNELYTIKRLTLKDEFADPSKLSTGTDWQKVMYKNALMHSYNLSVAGGSDKMSYLISSGYMSQDGIAYGSGYDRINLRTNLEVQVNSWMKIGVSTAISRSTQEITISDDDLVLTTLLQTPNVVARNADGSFGGPDDDNYTQSNPLGLAMLKDNSNEKANIRSNIYLDFTPIKGLSLKTEFSSDLGVTNTSQFTPTYEFGAIYNSEISSSKSKSYANYWAWRNIATYQTRFLEDHSINAMIGHEMTSSKWEYLYGKRLDGSNQLNDLNAGDSTTATNSGSSGETNFVSFFGRLFYSYKDRYLLTATLRYDGSSRFAGGNQWGAFPSFALAWRIGEEQFVKDLGWVNNMKLRLGYGEVGNSNVESFAYAAMLSNVSTNWGPGYLTGNIPNPDLTWETTRSYNVGFDFSVLNDRISLEADYYYKKTDDLLLSMSLPGYLGTSGQGAAAAPWGNAGSILNKGFEFSLNTVNIENRHFQWKSSFVFSKNRNKVKSMNTESGSVEKSLDLSGGSSIVTRTAVGRSIGEFYGYQIAGRINSANDLYDSAGNLKVALPEGATVGENGVWVGDFLYKNQNDDNVINENDRTYLGSPLPKFTYGIGNTFSYKGFDLSIYLTGSHGGKVFNWTRRYIDNPGGTTNLSTRAIDYAKIALINPEGSSSDIYNMYIQSGNSSMPRISASDANDNNRVSDRFIEDGSYLRISNISLSYNFPRKVLSTLRLNNLKVYLNLQNVYTFTKYSGYDPEVGMTKDQYSSSGQSALLNAIDTGRYPTPRIYTFGINVGF